MISFLIGFMLGAITVQFGPALVVYLKSKFSSSSSTPPSA